MGKKKKKRKEKEKERKANGQFLSNFGFRLMKGTVR
jgi:hypothetical protein